MAVTRPGSTPAGGARHGVRVVAAGRLHLGFFDPSASLGRRFGSVGLCVDGLQTELELRPAPRDQMSTDAPEARDTAAGTLGRLADGLAQLREHTGCRQALALHLREALPEHAGLGSGTQLALALGRAFARLHGLDVPTPTLARWLGRGLRSGIGIAGFDHGGLIVDGGPSADGTPAPPLSRIELPAPWRIVLAIDPARRGLSGTAEQRAMAQLAPLSRAQAADLCHHVLMALLPGAACSDFAAFALGVNHVQRVLGQHFAPAQDGRVWTSPRVGNLMEWWQAHAPQGAAIGQTSWGPTGFAIVPSAEAAEGAIEAARRAGQCDAALHLRVVSPRNHGAAVSALAED